MPKQCVKSGILPTQHGFFGREGAPDKGALANPVLLKQVHGATCLHVNDVLPDKPEADALITTNPDLTIGIVTADCAPVLFYAPLAAGNDAAGNDIGGGVIGAAHAGWYGAFSGVLEATIVEMMRAGAKLPDIRAAIGPCIAKKSYEVDADFEKPFLHEDPESDRFFHPGKTENKRYFDLGGYCSYRLARANIGQIDLIDHDTYTMPDAYFSHRRGTHTKIPETGRQLSLISLKTQT